jgi:hypothetical protein
MAKSKSTRPRSVKVDTPQAPKADDFDRLYDRMTDEICALKCVLSTIEQTDWEESSELSAAVVLLRGTYARIDELHAGLGGFAHHREQS